MQQAAGTTGAHGPAVHQQRPAEDPPLVIRRFFRLMKIQPMLIFYRLLLSSRCFNFPHYSSLAL